jgi:PAS domain S-box-containing protein
MALAIGAGLSMAAFVALRGVETRSIENEVRRIGERRALVLGERIDDAVASVRAVRGLYVAPAPPGREDFSAFAGELAEATPELQAVEWVPRVTRSRRGAYEAAARRDGIRGFRITEQTAAGTLVAAKGREVYYPVYFVAPRAGNGSALGFDFAASPARLAALSRARDSGRVAITAQIPLIQTGKPGFLVVVPVYARGAPTHTTEERRRALDGFVVGAVRADTALATALAASGAGQVEALLVDRSGETDSVLAFAGAGGAAAVASPTDGEERLARAGERYVQSFPIRVGGRTWQLIAAPTPEYVAASHGSRPWTALGVGLALATLLAAYLGRGSWRHARIEVLIDERTAELSEATSSLSQTSERLETLFRASPLAIVSLRDGNRVTSWSPAAEELFGWTAGEALGRPLPSLPADRPEEFGQYRTRVLREGAALRFETQLQHKDGSTIDVAVHLAELRGQPGQPSGYVALIADVGERKRAEESLHRRDAMLRAISGAVERLLRGEVGGQRLGAEMDGLLEDLAAGADVSRAFLCENQVLADGSLAMTERHEGRAAGLGHNDPGTGLQDLPYAGETLSRWRVLLEAGQSLEQHLRELPDEDRARFSPDVRSIAIAPVFVGGSWWGAIGFEERRSERVWGPLELGALTIAAGIIGAGLEGARAAGALGASEERFRTAFEEAALGIAIVDLDGRLRRVNRALCEIVDYTTAELLELHFPEITQPDDRGAWAEHTEQLLAGELKTIRAEQRCRRKDGSEAWVLLNTSLVRDATGEPHHLVAEIQDVTDRKRAELALRESEERFRAVADSVPVLVWMSDPEGRVTFVNRGWLEFTGGPHDEQPNPWRVLHPDDVDRVRSAYQAAIQACGELEIEYRLRRYDGEYRWVFDRAAPRFLPDGAFAGLTGVATDVTDRKRADEERRRFFTLSLDMLCIVGFDGFLRTVNPSYERFMGQRSEELLQRSFAEFIHPEDREAVSLALTKLAAGLETSFEARLAAHGGEYRWTLWTARPVPEERILYAAGRDITERKRAEEEAERLLAYEREQVERLLELDRMQEDLLATVSHELRTPLTNILGYLPLALENVIDAQQRRVFEVVDRNAKRLLHLVEDLLLVAQLESGELPIERRPIDLEVVIRESVDSARPDAEQKGVSVEVATEPVAGYEGDHGRLVQLMDNLLSNAVKFTPPGGRIAVRLVSDVEQAVIEVEDSGTGIPEGEQDRLFERFFRVSEARRQAVQGTGLGLTIVKAIAEAHGGSVSVQSAFGQGATFRVELPMAGQARAAA